MDFRFDFSTAYAWGILIAMIGMIICIAYSFLKHLKKRAEKGKWPKLAAIVMTVIGILVTCAVGFLLLDAPENEPLKQVDSTVMEPGVEPGEEVTLPDANELEQERLSIEKAIALQERAKQAQAQAQYRQELDSYRKSMGLTDSNDN